MIKSRFSLRRWVAALSLSLTVPLLAGCGIGRQVADSGSSKFWRRGEAQPTAVAETDKAEPKADATGRVKIESLGDPEPKVEVAEAVEGADPFLATTETVEQKPVRPVVAREVTPPRKPVAKPTAQPKSTYDPVAEQLAQLRREAAAEQQGTATETAGDEPSMEWADDLPTETADAPKASESVESLAAPEPKPETRPVAAKPEDVIAEIVEKPVVEKPAVKKPTVERTPNLEDLLAAPQAVETSPVQDPSMIVDTIEIRPRKVFDPNVTKTSAASREGLRREVEAVGETRDALWSFENDEAEPATTIPTTDETGDDAAIEAGFNAPAETTGLAPMAGTESEELESAAAVETDPLLLLPPANPEVPTEREPEAFAALALPPLGPTLPSSSGETEKSADTFPFDPDPEVVTALDSLDFEKDPEPAATPATSSLGWWFGGISLAAVALIWRARKFLS